jgi:hyperosmotically inducible protein
MTKNKLAALVAAAALAALAAGCSDTTGNANVVGNANGASNQAVVVNNNGNANTVGVNTTNSNTKKAPTREEYDKNKATYSEEAKKSGSTIGQGAEDGWLWTKTKYELAATDDLRDSTINVDVNNAVVTLRGTVATAAQKSKAEQVAKSIDGVKSVKNELKVSANGDKKGDAGKTENKKT